MSSPAPRHGGVPAETYLYFVEEFYTRNVRLACQILNYLKNKPILILARYLHTNIKPVSFGHHKLTRKARK